MKELFLSHPVVVLASSLFITGFLGSWHCGLMCGPMACFLASKKQLVPYQIGRGISYVLAGAFAGQISYWLINSYSWLKYVSVGLICVLLLINFFSSQFKPYMPKSMTQIYFRFRESGFMLGLLSLLLPCGWLYTFILSSMAAGSAYGGALVMFVFWLSTLPALTTAPLVLKNLVERADIRTKKISSIVLLLAGLYSILTFLFLHP